MKHIVLCLLLFCSYNSFSQIKIFFFKKYNLNISLNSSKDLQKYKVDLKSKSLSTHVLEIQNLLKKIDLIEQIKMYQDSLELTDWLTYKLIEEYSLYATKNKTQSLVKSIILSKLGYNINIKYNYKYIFGFIETNEKESCCLAYYEQENKVYIPFRNYYSSVDSTILATLLLDVFELSTEGRLFNVKLTKFPKFKSEIVNKLILSHLITHPFQLRLIRR